MAVREIQAAGRGIIPRRIMAQPADAVARCHEPCPDHRADSCGVEDFVPFAGLEAAVEPDVTVVGDGPTTFVPRKAPALAGNRRGRPQV